MPEDFAQPTTARVRYDQQGPVAVITMADGKMNCVNRPMRADLLDALVTAHEDPGTTAIVLAAEGPAWCAGADLNEMDSEDAEADPNLHRTLIGYMDAMEKPVIAAIGGVALGGGLELALGCHYRLAAPGAKVGLPEVTLGLFPGAGGTQRLTRALGLEAASNVILSGRVHKARDFEGTGLFDEIVSGELLARATGFAQSLASGACPPRLRDLKVAMPNAQGYLELVRMAVKSNPRRLPGQLPAIDAIEASVTLPFDEGLEVEYEGFRAMRASLASYAYRHAFLAERRAGVVEGLDPKTPLRPTASVAVIGAGVMGQGIAMACAEAGYQVTLLDLGPAALERAVMRIGAQYDRAVTRGRMSDAAKSELMARLIPATDYEDIAQHDLVIEAVLEEMPVKKAVFERLDAVMRPGAILATNTSTLDVNRIAGFTHRPGDVVGLHFFNPANIMRLLEVVRGAATAPDVLATVLKVGKRLGKVNVVAGVCDGFIGNRMVEQYMRQAQFMIEEGATPAQVDAALERWGMAMGPFRMNDLAGNDITGAVRARQRAEHPEAILPAAPDLVLERGWLGQKTGLGWYRHDPAQRRPQENTELTQALTDWRAAQGISPRRISDAEIVDRCLLALVNEGAAVLAEGIAQRASDIDVVYLSGYGFPVAKGGPMYAADSMGLSNVLRRMREFTRLGHGDAGFWTPHPLLQKLNKSHRNLKDYGAKQ